MRKIVMSGLFGLVAGMAISVPLSMGNSPKELLRGKIVKESFYPAKGFLSSSRYNAVIELSSGEERIVSKSGGSARETDLKYDVGDSVNVIRTRNGDYIFLSPN